jgi:hypothetical protein
MITLLMGNTVCKGPRTLLTPPEPETLPDKIYLRKLILINSFIDAVAVEVRAIAVVAFSALSSTNKLSPASMVVLPIENR